MIRSYSELITLSTFEERFAYLALRGKVGDITFGVERDLNQMFYQSHRWRRLRNQIILRDNGCDLAIAGLDIHRGGVIHHLNPLTPQQVIHQDESLMDPENLIMTSHQTHNAIHYGTENYLPRALVERTPGDTLPWKRKDI